MRFGNLGGQDGVGCDERVGGLGLSDDGGSAERTSAGDLGRLEGDRTPTGSAVDFEGLRREHGEMRALGLGQKFFQRMAGQMAGGGG